MVFQNKYLYLIGLFIFSVNVFANVNVTSGGSLNLCVGTTYTTIGKITIEEGVLTDFGSNANVQIYEINAPSNFEFNPGNGSVTASGADITFSALTVTATKITLYYLVNAAASVDKFELTNIQIRATSPSGSQNLVRTGGNANQTGNNTGDNKVHAEVTSNQAYVSLSLGALSNLCSNDADKTLSGGNPGGGTFSGSFVTGGTTFSPANAGSGTYTITYTANQNGCPGSATGIIKVNAKPAVTFFGLDNTYCSNGPDDQLTGFPSGGTFSGSMAISGNLFKPSVPSVGVKNITYSYTDANGCTDASTQQTTILQAPSVSITLSPDRTDYSNKEDSILIGGTQSNPSSGGTITVSGNGVSAGNDGKARFYPNIVGQGSTTITRILTAANGCSASASKIVSVSATSSTTINGLSSNYCSYQSPVTISVPNGKIGFFSGQGVIDNNSLDNVAVFDPSMVSSYNVPINISFYEYYLGTYLLNAIETITIWDKPTVQIIKDNSPNSKSVYCSNDDIVTLSAIVYPAGGIGSFSGPGVTNNTFNPKTAAPGIDTIKYMYTDVYGCENFAININTVKTAPSNVGFSGLKDNYCSNHAATELIVNSNILPSGGIGSFTSGGVDSNALNKPVFNPSILIGSINSKTYTVVYTYKTTDGCSASFSKNTTVYKIPDVKLNGLNSKYCISDAEVTLNGNPSNGFGGGTGTYTIKPVLADILVDNKFFPKKTAPGEYLIKYTFTDGTTECVNADSVRTTVYQLPNVNFTNLDTSYCALVGTRVEMNGSPVGTGGVYTSIGGTASITSGIFNVDASGVGKHTIIFTYTDAFGCAASVTKITKVYGSPQTKNGVKTPVKLSTICENDFITLRDNNSMLTTKPEASSFIQTANWLIDTTQIVKNYLGEPIVQLSAGNHKIVYKLTTDKGCNTTFDTTVSVGSYPKTNFTWDEICNNEDTKFQNTTPALTVGKVTRVGWDFSDPLNPANISINLTAGINGNTSHTYQTPTTYKVFLTAYSDYNCVTTKFQNIFILDSKQISRSQPYSNDFNDLIGDWVTNTAIDTIPSSWALGVPNKKYIKSTNGAWSTDLSNAFNPDEKSYVYSPCFTMDNTITKPMIHLDIFSMTNLNASGANLQYSLNGKDWKPLGKRAESGVNWYNNTGNIASRPSGSELDQDGWTGLDSLSRWKNARHIFDAELGTNKNIRFRISFAGNKDTTDGFAFDNVWIGDRTRLILAEHFTNSSSNNTKIENAALNTLITANQTGGRPKDIVALQYHTAFPGADQMYSRNIPDAGARSLYYGVTQVPYSAIDGSYYKGNTLGISQKTIDTRSLYDPAFELNVNSVLTSNTVSGSVEIKNKIPVSNNVTVYISVLERYVNNITGANGETVFEWVHAKFLPDAAGTSFSGTWSGDRTENITFSWPFTSTNIYNPEKLAVIAFVQDNITKEIYQTAYKGLGATVTTGVFDPNEATSTVLLYPNPANDLVHVILNGTLAGDYSWCVIDGLGKVIDQGIAADQTDGFTINTQSYPSGFYTLRLSNQLSGIKTQKFVVVH